MGIAVDDHEAEPAVRQLGLGQQHADDGHAEPQAEAVDHGGAHGGEIDLERHLYGIGAEAAPHPDQHGIDLAQAGRHAERHGEEARHRAHGDLGAGAGAEPHDHDGEEDDLGRWSQIVEIGLEGAPQKSPDAEDEADEQAGGAADDDRDGDLSRRRLQVAVERR